MLGQTGPSPRLSPSALAPILRWWQSLPSFEAGELLLSVEAGEVGDAAVLAPGFRHSDDGGGTGVCCVSCTGPRGGLWPIRGWWRIALVAGTEEVPQV